MRFRQLFTLRFLLAILLAAGIGLVVTGRTAHAGRYAIAYDGLNAYCTGNPGNDCD